MFRKSLLRKCKLQDLFVIEYEYIFRLPKDISSKSEVEQIVYLLNPDAKLVKEKEVVDKKKINRRLTTTREVFNVRKGNSTKRTTRQISKASSKGSLKVGFYTNISLNF